MKSDDTRAEDVEPGDDPAEPPKPPERLRREAMFLLPWQVLLLAAALWGAVYAWIGMFWPVEELERLADGTVHDSLQLGVTIFLGAELAYYLYLSAAFRGLRDWGMGVWGFAFVVFVLNLMFAI